METNNYLYFLGAGASAKALPLVFQFPDQLAEFQKILKATSMEEPGNQNPKTTATIKEQLIEDIAWMRENLATHASVDTFAKKLFFKSDIINLRRLKAVLSCFFVGMQSLRPVDYRYDSFFASILKKTRYRKVELPEDIRFLTWNYDSQLEKALFGYTDDADQVISDITLGDRAYRLNGYCGTTQPGHIGPEVVETFTTRDKMSNVVLTLYTDYIHNNGTPDINFAWEMSDDYFNIKIQQVSKGVRTLIIIGYSFPFFNREIDKKIFESLPNLESVYIQVPSGFFPGIAERISAITTKIPKPIHIEDTSQFYIPFDYRL